MNKFNHNFSLYNKAPHSRFYASDDNIARIDFVSNSCIRVAHYKAGSSPLPTFSVCPDNALLLNGRDRFSLDGFSLCEPEITEEENGESFVLPCGVKVKLDLHNFSLSYHLDEKELFSDRKPLAYNLDGEFGKDKYHYQWCYKGEIINGKKHKRAPRFNFP